jgi:uncharacterized membrane protein
MKTAHALYLRMILSLLALFGFLDSLYLSLSRIQTNTTMVCPSGGGCEAVQASVWSTIPPGNGLPVAFLGMGGYLVFLILGLLSTKTNTVGPVPLPTLILFIASAGVLFSLYLVIIQLVVIQEICFWCMVSAGIELGIWITAVFIWRVWRTTNPHGSQAT